MVLKFAIISHCSIPREADATPAFYNHLQGCREVDCLVPGHTAKQAGPGVLSLRPTCRLTPLGLQYTVSILHSQCPGWVIFSLCLAQATHKDRLAWGLAC